MRSEDEVRKLIETLDRLNAACENSIRTTYENSARTGMKTEDVEDIAGAFNSNAMMLCALRWVMGEDTIQESTSGEGRESDAIRSQI